MPNTPVLLLSVPEFCRSHGIARSHFYKLLKEGRGPRIIKLGRRTLISTAAAAAWRRSIEETPARCAADDKPKCHDPQEHSRRPAAGEPPKSARRSVSTTSRLGS